MRGILEDRDLIHQDLQGHIQVGKSKRSTYLVEFLLHGVMLSPIGIDHFLYNGVQRKRWL